MDGREVTLELAIAWTTGHEASGPRQHQMFSSSLGRLPSISMVHALPHPLNQGTVAVRGGLSGPSPPIHALPGSLMGNQNHIRLQPVQGNAFPRGNGPATAGKDDEDDDDAIYADLDFTEAAAKMKARQQEQQQS